MIKRLIFLLITPIYMIYKPFIMFFSIFTWIYNGTWLIENERLNLIDDWFFNLID